MSRSATRTSSAASISISRGASPPPLRRRRFSNSRQPGKRAALIDCAARARELCLELLQLLGGHPAAEIDLHQHGERRACRLREVHQGKPAHEQAIRPVRARDALGAKATRGTMARSATTCAIPRCRSITWRSRRAFSSARGSSARSATIILSTNGSRRIFTTSPPTPSESAGERGLGGARDAHKRASRPSSMISKRRRPRPRMAARRRSSGRRSVSRRWSIGRSSASSKAASASFSARSAWSGAESVLKLPHDFHQADGKPGDVMKPRADLRRRAGTKPGRRCRGGLRALGHFAGESDASPR